MTSSGRRARLLRLLAAFVVLASCSVPESKHGCANDGDCLSGRVCRASVCEAPGPCKGDCGADTGADASGGGAARASHSSGASAGRATQGDGGTTQASNSMASGDVDSENLRGAGANSAPEAGQSGAPNGVGSSERPSAPLSSSGGDISPSGGNAGELWNESGGATGDSSGGAGAMSGTPNAGAAGEPPVRCDPFTIVHECFSGETPWFRPIVTRSAGTAAVLGTGADSSFGFHLLASRRDTDTMVVSWTDANFGWNGFGCFDSVPSPSRAAAATLHSGQPEFFVIGRCGLLYERALITLEAGGGWTPWFPVQLPWPDSLASDVAAALTPDATVLLYVADRGTVYVRNRSDAHDTTPFGAWRTVAGDSGAVLAVGTRSDGRQQVFTLDANGRPLTTLQGSSALEAPYGAFQDFGSAELPPLIDIEGVSGQQRPLELFALDVEGVIWTRRQTADGEFTPWATLELLGRAGRFKQLSASMLPLSTDNIVALVGIENAWPPAVQVRLRFNGQWQEDWQALQ